MAIAWFEWIFNFHPTDPLNMYFNEPNRHVTLTHAITGKKSEVTKNRWYKIPAGSAFRADQLAAPWGSSQYLEFSHAQSPRTAIRLQVWGSGGWDYLHISDQDGGGYEKPIDVGSLGDAAGTNYSGWAAYLDREGNLGIHCMWRQGMTRDDILKMGDTLKLVYRGGKTAWDVGRFIGDVIEAADASG